MSIDGLINQAVAPVSKALSQIIFAALPVGDAQLPLIVAWLIAGGVFFTVYLQFINIRGFRHALRIVRGDYADPDHDGEVSHFQALSAALSGTVGLGNIAGVAVAISLGGPGATFWMILAGVLGMSLKFVECTLAVKYRRLNPDGTISGGPMYYLQEGLAKYGWPRLGRAGAVFFCCMCVPASFGLFSVNQSFQQFSLLTGFEEGWIFGLVVAVLVGIVIIGGIKSIARVTEKLVPLMCGIYVTAAIFVLLTNFASIPGALWLIVSQAFAPDSISGGIIGVIVQGFRRAAYSNEAGLGSAPIAHAAVRTNEPATEGFVAVLEPFVDTVIVCTMTALVVVVTGAYRFPDLDGIAITSAAFASVIWWFPVLLTLAVFLFAFSTIVTWAYYGLKSWTYLVGHTRTTDLVFKVMICMSVVIGAAMDLYAVIDFVDSVMFAMAIPNILALYFLAGEVKKETASYLERVQSGAIRPTYGRRAAPVSGGD